MRGGGEHEHTNVFGLHCTVQYCSWLVDNTGGSGDVKMDPERRRWDCDRAAKNEADSV